MRYRCSGVRRWLIVLGGLLVLTSQLAGQAEAPPPAAAATSDAAATSGIDSEQVVIVANRDLPASVELARYYAERRGIASENIIALPLPLEETIKRDVFTRTVWEPLQAVLLERRLLEGVASTSERDALGRPKVAITGHHLRYLVLMHGVPLRVDGDRAIDTLETGRLPAGMPVGNMASVDGELATLALGNPAVRGLVVNPLFQRPRPGYFDAQRVVRVARLDGPKPEHVRRVIDQALTAERDGVWGRAYIDSGGPYPAGDQWLAQTAEQLLAAGFDVDHDRAKPLLPLDARFDAPLFYFGWYGSGIGGVMKEAGFAFPPGAVALHIHSFSATTLRGRGSWVAPFIERGVTATFGNVYEPLLTFTHRPDLIVQSLLAGAEMGEAACFSLPALSWQAVFVGDPLFRPFARSRETLWQERATLSAEARRYVVLQRSAQLARAGDTVGALRLVRDLAADDRSPAVALVLALRRAAVGDQLAAADALAKVRLRLFTDPTEWTVYAQIAHQLTAWGRHADALEIWRNFSESRRTSPPFQNFALKQALSAAEKAGDRRAARLLQERLDALAPKPKPDAAKPAAAPAPKSAPAAPAGS